MSRLLIKFATRNRPEKFKDRMNRFRDLASGKHEIRYVVSCDHDDPTMNNEDMISWMDEFSKDSDLVYHFGNSKSKIEAINTDMEGEVFDVLLNTSDDMVPMKQDFDDVIFQVYSQAYPDFSGAVKFSRWTTKRSTDDLHGHRSSSVRSIRIHLPPRVHLCFF